MANKSTSAHATRKHKMGKVKGMHISLVSNGAKSTMQHEPPEDSSMGMMGGGSMDGEEAIHPSMAHLVKHIKSNLGPHMTATTGQGGAATGATPAAPSGTQPDNEPDEDDE